MSNCPHTDSADKCACYSGCGCDTQAEPESWGEYVLAWSIWNYSAEDTSKGALRERMSNAIKARRCSHIPVAGN